MLNNLKKYLPEEIEKESLRIITEELGNRDFPEFQELIIKRVIHTTADFTFADNLEFSEGIENSLSIFCEGATIYTDTHMALSGINKKALKQLGMQVKCFISDEDVAQYAQEKRATRAAAAIDKALLEEGNKKIFVIGNAPTALVRIYELVKGNLLDPELIIGVPVGFVNVVESKELIKDLNIPYIVARGRRGGSNVAASIINAIMYQKVVR